jgi:hypothetical protein
MRLRAAPRERLSRCGYDRRLLRLGVESLDAGVLGNGVVMTLSMDRPPPTDVHRDEQILRSPSRSGKGGSRSTGAALAVLGIAFASIAACASDDEASTGTSSDTTEVVADDTTADTTGVEPADTEPAGTEPAATEPESPPATTPDKPATDPETDPRMADWPSVLSGATASGPPQVVNCPTGSPTIQGAVPPTPEYLEVTLGPIDAVAAFDSKSHTLFVVRSGADQSEDGVLVRETVAGRLDVCSGTWSPISADFGTLDDGTAGSPMSLVYDADSDALVAFAHDGVRVYDASTDAWNVLPDAVPQDGSTWVRNAAYHPGSGMIIVSGPNAVYDVDRAEWHLIPETYAQLHWFEFLGVDGEDRLVYATDDRDHVTRLLDPTTGQAIDIATPGRPEAKLWNAYGPSETVGQAGGTVYVSDHAMGTICGFDASTLKWDDCVDHQIDMTLSPGDGVDHAIVGDPINDLLIIVPPSGPILAEPLP